MGVSDLFQEHFNLFIFILGCWIITAVWISAAVAGAVENRYTTAQVFLLIGSSIASSIAATHFAIFSGFLFAGMLFLSLTIPTTLATLNKRDLALLEAQIAQKQISAVYANPNNVAAQAKLAEICQRIDLIAPAVAHLEIAITLAPSAFGNEKIMLKSWKRDLDSGMYPKTLTCPQCRKENDPVEVICPKCKASMIYLIIAGLWMPEGLPLRILKTWGVALFVAIAAPLVAIHLQPIISMPIEILLLGSGIWLFWKSVQ